MATTPAPHERLIEKIRSLPPGRMSELEDYVDFLSSRVCDPALVEAFTGCSEAAFREVWDNDEDAVYDRI